jgi:hypothetical protein
MISYELMFPYRIILIAGDEKFEASCREYMLLNEMPDLH